MQNSVSRSSKTAVILLLLLLFSGCIPGFEKDRSVAGILYISLLRLTASSLAVPSRPTIQNLKENSTVQSGFMIGQATGTLTSIEVSLDSGSFQKAVGTSSWTFAFPTGSSLWKMGSRHKITVRAENSGVYSETLTVNVRKGENKDFNGDGYGDLAVSAGVGYSSSFEGNVFIFNSKGKDGITASSVAQADLNITGLAASGRFGYSIHTEDLNNDGYSDLIVGAPEENANQGRVYIYLSKGKSGLASAPSSSISGASAGEKFGNSLASGDINGDRYPELAVGAFESSQGGSQRGAVYIFNSGQNGISVSSAGSADRSIRGAVNLDLFGVSVGIGDINGDGFGDLAVGSSHSSFNGRVYIFHSAGTSGLSATILTAADRTITGSASELGRRISVADINNDGFQDVLASTNGSNKAYLFLSSGGGGITAVSPAGASKTITGISTSNFGSGIALGDLNRDGLSDLFIGDNNINTQKGQAYILYSAEAGITANVNAANSDVIIDGSSNDHQGTSFGLNDLDGDGILDLIIGGNRSVEVLCGGINGSIGIFYSSASLFSTDISSAKTFIRSADTGDCFGASVR